MPPSVVELELWKIFTYYTLHADPTSPENFKVSHFIRFAKDCQIISARLTKAALNLELARVARSKKSAGDDSNGQNIYFLDFVALLEYLAPMVYPEKTAEISIRRLLLENVFLLAGRRIPVDANLNVGDETMNKLLREKFGRSLQNIFNHYVDMAGRRQIQDVVAEKMRAQAVQQRLDQHGLGRGTVAHEKMKQGTNLPQSPVRKLLKNRQTIGHKEFFQFSQDFKLKSSALLSAIVVGDIYLTAVPLNDTAGGGGGSGAEVYRCMDFDKFLKSIVLMALVAYKEAPRNVNPVDKIKALLLYMWRTINSREKTQQAVATRNGTSKTVEGYANSLNIHGSGLFSVTMQDVWKNDGFCTYVSSESDREFSDEANEALRRLSTFEVSGTLISKSTSTDSGARMKHARNIDKDTGDDIVAMTGFENDTFPETIVGAGDPAIEETGDAGEPEKSNDRIEINAGQIAALFRKKPELAEFIFLEVLSMPGKA